MAPGSHIKQYAVDVEYNVTYIQDQHPMGLITRQKGSENRSNSRCEIQRGLDSGQATAWSLPTEKGLGNPINSVYIVGV